MTGRTDHGIARTFGRLAVSFTATTLLTGCISHYTPPRMDEPHAIVKVRRTYDRRAGTTLREVADIGRDRAFERLTNTPATTTTDAILVRPGPIRWRLSSEFFHIETRIVSETYYTQEAYTDTETYPCGSGTSYQTCTRSVTRYRSVPRTQLVPRNVEVTDGACAMPVEHQAEVGHVYLLQLHYLDNGVCRATCYEQVATSLGADDNRPCSPPRADD